MRTYFFDLKDGVPTRDRKGIQFATAAGAIEHSKALARRLLAEPRLNDPNLLIVVVDESGAEITASRCIRTRRNQVSPSADNRVF